MKKGTIKVSILYPDGEGKTFDMDYYCNKHVPMVAELLGDAVIGATVEKGIAGESQIQRQHIRLWEIYILNLLKCFRIRSDQMLIK